MSMNAADAAHIHAISEGWARYDEELSKELETDISNLMLMCKVHHHLIDNEGAADHPADRLLEMKRKHEGRIERLTSIGEDKKSQIILYGANIGAQNVLVNWNRAAQAMVPNYYPAESRAIELGVKNDIFEDHETWCEERKRLRRQFAERVTPLIVAGDAPHFSIFALASMPLLMELGCLLTDIPAADVYQLHREPPDWKWQDAEVDGFDYAIQEPDTKHKVVALNLSLSASIDNSRITSILGDECSVWEITVPEPGNDFLKSSAQRSMFRARFRDVLNRIKAKHGEDAIIHVFPAVPVAVAVEVGRVRMPKADLPMRIYDHNRKLGGFAFAFDIGEVPSGS